MDQRGFTLIEVLVALVLVSLMSLMAWRALDGMGRAGELTNTNEQSLQRLQVGLAQWTADLDAILDTGVSNIPSLDFDGQRLRLTRQSSQPHAGVVVAAWTLRSTDAGLVWQRWASPPLTTQAALRDAWSAAERWSRTPQPEDEARTVSLMPTQGWQLFYFRDGAWSNAQSAAGVAASTAASAATAAGAFVMPDGVQLVLTLPSGKLTRDWVQPVLGATR
jgi:general secretion pathway protein J